MKLPLTISNQIKLDGGARKGMLWIEVERKGKVIASSREDYNFIAPHKPELKEVEIRDHPVVDSIQKGTTFYTWPFCCYEVSTEIQRNNSIEGIMTLKNKENYSEQASGIGLFSGFSSASRMPKVF